MICSCICHPSFDGIYCLSSKFLAHLPMLLPLIDALDKLVTCCASNVPRSQECTEMRASYTIFSSSQRSIGPETWARPPFAKPA